MKNINILIVGSMKSGTSYLFEVLSQHPDLCAPINNRKETEFFSENQPHEMEANEYEELFEEEDSTCMGYIEASTGYTKFPMEIDVPKRIHEKGIKPYIIYSVRNPIARIESEYNWKYLHRKDTNIRILDPQLIFKSMYYTQMKQYKLYFEDREKYFIVDFEDIRKKPKDLAKRIFSWCGLKEIEINENTKKNETRSIGRIEDRLERTSIEWKSFFPERLRNKARSILNYLDVSAKTSMNEKQESKVRECIERDIRRFGKYFEFPVSKWGF